MRSDLEFLGGGERKIATETGLDIGMTGYPGRLGTRNGFGYSESYSFIAAVFVGSL